VEKLQPGWQIWESPLIYLRKSELSHYFCFAGRDWNLKFLSVAGSSWRGRSSKRGNPLLSSERIDIGMLRRGACVLLVLLGASVAAKGQSISFAGIWTRQSSANGPSARYAAVTANDASGSVVLFGGNNDDDVLNDTWIWDGENWKEQLPANRPPARSNAAMANDRAGSVVLFGGFTTSGDLQDTWVWDGRNWVQQFPANSPTGRSGASMVGDASGHVMLFGGIHQDEVFNDTWIWDGKNWTQQSPANSPGARESPAMANDGAGHVVMFGGMNRNSRMLNETWIWDGKNWTQQSPPNSPGARESASMASDASGRVVLFGGYPGFGATDLDDTWIWDGTNWTQWRSAGGPSARVVAALVYHAPGGVLLFGGLSQRALNDAWVYEHGSVNFGSVKVGSRATLTLGYNIQSEVTLAANVKVVNNAAPNFDFALSGTPTCTGKKTGDSWCGVTISFAPRAAGMRTGAVQLMDGSGRLLVTTAIFGQGSGAVPAARPVRKGR
jgi:Galactose oxidase, central domain/Kelch motif